MNQKQKLRKDRENQIIRSQYLMAIENGHAQVAALKGTLREHEAHRQLLLPGILRILDDHFKIVRFTVENQFDGEINGLRARIKHLESFEAKYREELKALGGEEAA